MDLYSNTRPLNLYDSKLAAMDDNHGKQADYPGLRGYVEYENVLGAPDKTSPIYSLFVIIVGFLLN
jgi:hypothetical protein